MILDASAWIEFFQGTETGRKVGYYLRTERNFTSVVTFSEIMNWCMRTGRRDLIERCVPWVKSWSVVIGLDENISVTAGKINHERKKKIKSWGMLDSFLLSTAMLNGLKILTKDSDFRDLENVEML